MLYRPLTSEEEYVMTDKSAGYPFTGELLGNKTQGVYICKHCHLPLYRTQDTFDSSWSQPGLGEEIFGAIHQKISTDGKYIEIICVNCKAHLGHIFVDGKFTPKNMQHCVNSSSIEFVPDLMEVETDTAFFAGGCFWGTEYFFSQIPGIHSVTVGYMGGRTLGPTYKEVCSGKTGHYETNEITYDAAWVSYEDLVKLFFEIHDFTQTDGQGPDIGQQYLSVIFYHNAKQKQIAEKYIRILNEQGYSVATRLIPATTFWDAEDYHQHYYRQKGAIPYCHSRKRIF